MARKSASGRGSSGKPRRRPAGGRAEAAWLYGIHAVAAALANPERTCERLLVADDAAAARAAAVGSPGPKPAAERVARGDIEAVLPAGAVHQGIAALARPLADPGLEAAIERAKGGARPCIVVLDQVTDPQNVGAIIRTAGAFGAGAVVMQDRHAPPVTGALAKAACGGLEVVDLVRETNLARALETLKARGFWCIGLDAAAGRTLDEARVDAPAALVLGAEGAGLRRLVAETCDALARIPQTRAVGSLNVSNAAAVALYAIMRPG